MLYACVQHYTLFDAWLNKNNKMEEQNLVIICSNIETVTMILKIFNRKNEVMTCVCVCVWVLFMCWDNLPSSDLLRPTPPSPQKCSDGAEGNPARPQWLVANTASRLLTVLAGECTQSAECSGFNPPLSLSPVCLIKIPRTIIFKNKAWLLCTAV